MADQNNLKRPSQEHLLAQEVELTATADQNRDHGSKSRAQTRVEHVDEARNNASRSIENPEGSANGGDRSLGYKIYRRRWFGLGQLVLLNIIVSWDVSGATSWTDVNLLLMYR